jgi:hypothetical protein
LLGMPLSYAGPRAVSIAKEMVQIPGRNKFSQKAGAAR